MKNKKDSFNDPKIKVPLFIPSISSTDRKVVHGALNRKMLTDGPQLVKFENKFANYVNSKYAVGVSNATSALFLSLKSLGIGKNDQVIVPDLTFVATVNAVLQTGATPVITDVEKDSMNISVKSIESNISKRTKAIIPVHFAGQACDMTKIMNIAKSKKLFVVEDCAHAVGTKFKNKHVGTFGDFGCFSFYPTKNLTTIEGGMIIGKNNKLIDQVKILRNHGLTRSLRDRYQKGYPWDYDVKEPGYNYRLDEIRSSLGLNQLNQLEKMNRKRRFAYKYYNELLSNINGIITPNEKNLQNNSCHLYIIRVKKNIFKISRNKLFEKLLSNGIRTSVHYKPLHKFLIYRKQGIIKNTKNSNELYNEILSLPLYPDIKKHEQNLVVDTILKIKNESK